MHHLAQKGLSTIEDYCRLWQEDTKGDGGLNTKITARLRLNKLYIGYVTIIKWR